MTTRRFGTVAEARIGCRAREQDALPDREHKEAEKDKPKVNPIVP